MNKIPTHKVWVLVAILAFFGAASLLLALLELGLLKTEEHPSVGINGAAFPLSQIYRDEQCLFQINYPCGEDCKWNSIAGRKNAHILREVTIPTNTDSVSITIGILTHDSVNDWNTALSNPSESFESSGAYFPLDLNMIAGALTMPIGNSTSMIMHPGGEMYPSIFTIRQIAERKALCGRMTRYYNGETCFLAIDPKYWMQVDTIYYQFHDDIVDLKENKAFHRQQHAVDEIMNTLAFSCNS